MESHAVLSSYGMDCWRSAADAVLAKVHLILLLPKSDGEDVQGSLPCVDSCQMQRARILSGEAVPVCDLALSDTQMHLTYIQCMSMLSITWTFNDSAAR